jgi:hypothetical protein
MPKTKLLANKIDSTNYLTLEELYKKLGQGFAPRTVKRMIQNGRIIQGTHFIRTKGNSGLIKVNLEEFQNYLVSLQG